MPAPTPTWGKKGTVTHVDFTAIAKALHVPLSVLVRFLKAHFSCPYIGGKFIARKEYEEIVEALYVFIKFFVLCPVCKLPELDIYSMPVRLHDIPKLRWACRSCPSSNTTRKDIGRLKPTSDALGSALRELGKLGRPAETDPILLQTTAGSTSGPEKKGRRGKKDNACHICHKTGHKKANCPGK